MCTRLGFIVSVFMVGAAQAQAPNLSVCDRTHQVRDAIVAWVERYDGISDCNKIGAVQLQGVGEVYNDIGPPSYRPLRLDGTGITELKQGDFAGLLSLTELHLQNNHLTTLPDSIFVGVPSLNRLYLNNNRLRKLWELYTSIPKPKGGGSNMKNKKVETEEVSMPESHKAEVRAIVRYELHKILDACTKALPKPMRFGDGALIHPDDM